MSLNQDERSADLESVAYETNPFAETAAQAERLEARSADAGTWSESVSPFMEAPSGPGGGSDSVSERLFAEAFEELRDEEFDEAVAFLAEETEQAVSDRFIDEDARSAAERERYAETYLGGVGFEARQYLEALENGLGGQDVESLSEDQLDEVLDRFDPQSTELTPAGEEFVKSLVRKAKKAVKFVAKAAKGIGKFAGAMLGPVLKRLRALIRPLLRRVLSFAVGRLPASLRPAAKTLAARFLSEEGEEEDNEVASPAQLTDVEALAESFDAALAEAMVGDGAGELEGEDSEGPEQFFEGRELETLAAARGALIDRLKGADDEQDLAPAIEQFAPALLGALRIGIRLAGRPKVVRFLAGYLGQMIRRWVGPSQSAPLSNAIVDTGLRLVSLEAEADGEMRDDEAGPVALAGVIEDSIRRLAETEDYVLDQEELLQLASAEAFNAAVGTHFPAKFVRAGLQPAPSLGGAFVARRARRVRSYKKYSRAPEVEITAQIADALKTFGGATVGATMRAAGAAFPFRARMHIYESAVGTSLPRMVRLDRTIGARGHASSADLHPLTPEAAGVLLREPKLGVAVPETYLQSRQRIAVGHRFYYLEPLGAAATSSGAATGRAARRRPAPSRSWVSVDPKRAKATIGIYLSEAEAQAAAAAIRQGKGGSPLLNALIAAFDAGRGAPRLGVAREDREEFEEFSPAAAFSKLRARFRRRLRRWLLPALANWARNNGEAFARAAAHPDPGVTILVRMTSLPAKGRGTPAIAVTATSGRKRR